MDGVANKEVYDQYGNPMREDDDDDEVYVKRRINTTLPKKNHTPWKRKVTMRGSIILRRTRRERSSLKNENVNAEVPNVIAKHEPWVHAKHVTQCFFITNPCNPSRVVVRRGKRNIIGMDGVSNEEDYD